MKKQQRGKYRYLILLVALMIFVSLFNVPGASATVYSADVIPGSNGSAGSNNNYYYGFGPEKAFDGNPGTWWSGWGAGDTLWLMYEFPVPYTITKVSMQGLPGNYVDLPIAYNFEAYDETTGQWVVLKSITNGDPGAVEFTFDNTKAYKKYRFNIFQWGDEDRGIAEVQMYETIRPDPLNLTATAGNAEVNLVWESVYGANNYDIKRSTQRGGPYTTIATAVQSTNFTDTNVTNNTTYYYVVTANLSSGGDTQFSNEVSATPRLPAPSLSGKSSNSQVVLNWGAIPNASGYKIKRATASGGNYAVIGTVSGSTVFVDANVTVGTTYFYIVSAIDAGGEGPNSNEISVTVKVPSSSALLSLSMMNGETKTYNLTSEEIDAFLQWYDARSNGIGPNYYVITENVSDGIYTTRQTYIPFDKIAFFEVSR